MKDAKLPEKVVRSMAKSFARKATLLCEKTGWVWNLGGLEGAPSADRIEELSRTLLSRVSEGTPAFGYGKIEVGCSGIGECDAIYWIRFMGEDLIEARWRRGLAPYSWGTVKVCFRKQKRVEHG